MSNPQELLEAVRELHLPDADWQEIEKRLTKDRPNAADYAFVKAIIRTRIMEDVPTMATPEEAEALAKAEEAAATLAIASLKAVTEDIDTVATALKHGELPQ